MDNTRVEGEYINRGVGGEYRFVLDPVNRNEDCVFIITDKAKTRRGGLEGGTRSLRRCRCYERRIPKR